MKLSTSLLIAMAAALDLARNLCIYACASLDLLPISKFLSMPARRSELRLVALFDKAAVARLALSTYEIISRHRRPSAIFSRPSELRRIIAAIWRGCRSLVVIADAEFAQSGFYVFALCLFAARDAAKHLRNSTSRHADGRAPARQYARGAMAEKRQ